MLRRPSVRYRRPLQALATVRGVIVLQVLANGAGALLVFLYLQYLFPVRTPEQSQRVGLNLTVFGAYLLVTLFVAFPLNRYFLSRAVAWVRDGREPTDKERLATLTQPFQQTASAFLGWVGAAVIFGILNEDATRVSLGIVLAGLVTCALLYLLLERHFRPVFALALQDANLPRPHREILPRIMMAWLLGSAVPIVALGLAPLGVPAEQRGELSARIGVLVVASVVAGGLIMRAAARGVADPIEAVRRAMARVEEGDLDVEVLVDHAGEIGRLQAGFNDMVEGLRERRLLHDLYGRQVGVDVARAALDQGPQLGGEERSVTALFVDLDDFTGFSETHEPAEVVEELNAFFSVVVEVVMAEGGFVNKFEGDAALCIFGAPTDQPDHADRALRAAARLPEVVGRLPANPSVGVGVASGRAIAGHIGTPERFEYTVIGDPVNVAARLTVLAKRQRAQVLAAGDTLACASAETAAMWRPVGEERLRGRRAPTVLWAPAALYSADKQCLPFA
ncbi:adenylate/guanylate cyclase domain-containing protein [Rhabdothermincola sediminis]|uniref:adenylate/guanylate cyclase domain-containing protein n=1 Tax=Rhabdothermincola sediminis TaxID=2751370 RepID=UPI001AA02FBB|nr:adenylate/guanylate cyclase domain-containing protein [Rhabdothermincola sediminis]